MARQRLLLLALLSLIITIGNSSLGDNTDCSDHSTYHVNATTSTDLTSSFKPTFGPLSNGSYHWTWTLATETYNTRSSTTSIRQALWLNVQPRIDLHAPDLGQLGCGLVVHGLKPSVLEKASKQQSGTCTNILSATCITELIDGTTAYAAMLSSSSFVGITEICKEFKTLGGEWKTLGITSKCSDDLADDAWIQSFRKFLGFCPVHFSNTAVTCTRGITRLTKLPAFASPELPSSLTCTPENNASAPHISWGTSTYSSPNFTSYDNLTRSMTPLISIMFENHTTDSNTTLGYAQSQLSCLRPTVVNGSRVPTTPLTSGDGRIGGTGITGRIGGTALFLTVLVGILGIARVYA